MKRHHFAAAAAAAALILAATSAQSRQPHQKEKPAEPKQRSALTRAELEKRFAESLSGVVFEGAWRMTGAGGLKRAAPLGKPKPERYSIESANKLDGDWWLIRARLEFAETDLTLPVRVRVVWAEDTPIITIDDVSFPGVGTYSARVMIYRGLYCGTWFGTNYGGVMSGRIIKADSESKRAAEPKDRP
jgi:hypothetical protein